MATLSKPRSRMFSARRVGTAVFVMLLAIQVPAWFWQTNPPVKAEPAWDSAETRALAKRACFDCHSNETVWPIYSRVAPVSWLVTRHVVEGREKLNFSEWGTAPAQGAGWIVPVAYADEGEGEGEGGERGRGRGREDPAEEAPETIMEGEMPPRDYLLLHPEARLSDAEKQQLARGLAASLR